MGNSWGAVFWKKKKAVVMILVLVICLGNMLSLEFCFSTRCWQKGVTVSVRHGRQVELISMD